MKGYSRPELDRSPVPGDLDRELIHGAQTYLACLRQHQTASSENKEAWAKFYIICDPLLRRFAISCHVLPNDVDDCVQSAWKDITAALPAFHDDGKFGRFGAWLHRIVHSKAMDIIRHRTRHPVGFLTPEQEAGLLASESDQNLEDRQQDESTRVRQVLAVMCQQAPPTSYRVFQLRFMERRSVREIAGDLNLTNEQVRYRCCRMKRKFRLLYEKYPAKDSVLRDPALTGSRFCASAPFAPRHGEQALILCRPCFFLNRAQHSGCNGGYLRERTL